jgi:MFS family permease
VGGFLYELGGYQLPFLAATGLVAVDGLARVFLIDAPVVRQTPRVTIRQLLHDPHARLITLAIALSAGGLGALEPTLPLFLARELQAEAGVVGLLFAVSTLTYAIASPMSGTLTERWGAPRLMMIGLAGLGAALMTIGFLPSLPAQAVLLGILGVANALTITPSLSGLAAVVDRRGDEAFGVAFALFNVAYAIGLVFGPPAGGVLTDVVGFPGAMLLCGIVPLVLGSVMFLRR